MREIVIKPKPVEEPKSEITPIVISSRKKLFDVDEALTKDEIIIPANVISKASEEIIKEEIEEVKVEEPAPEPEPEPTKILYDTEKALKNPESVVFSWQESEKKVEPETQESFEEQTNKTLEKLMEESSAKADEFVEDKTETPEKVVIVESAPPPAPPQKKKSLVNKTADMIVAVIFGVALLFGGKTAFDYVQEAESIKRIASQLEAQYPSDLPPDVSRSLGTFGQGSLLEPPTDVKLNLLSGDSFVTIIEVKPYYLLAKRKDGKIELRTGGSVGWRINNPGKFGWGDFAKKTGAIGEYSKYAVYPSYKEGMLALEVYLFGTNLYKNLTIQAAMTKFYSDDKSAAEEIARKISVALNVSRYRTKLSSLSSSQKRTMLKTIGDHEQGLKGIVRIYDDMEEFREKGF